MVIEIIMEKQGESERVKYLKMMPAVLQHFFFVGYFLLKCVAVKHVSLI